MLRGQPVLLERSITSGRALVTGSVDRAPGVNSGAVPPRAGRISPVRPPDQSATQQRKVDSCASGGSTTARQLSSRGASAAPTVPRTRCVETVRARPTSRVIQCAAPDSDAVTGGCPTGMIAGDRRDASRPCAQRCPGHGRLAGWDDGGDVRRSSRRGGAPRALTSRRGTRASGRSVAAKRVWSQRRRDDRAGQACKQADGQGTDRRTRPPEQGQAGGQGQGLSQPGTQARTAETTSEGRW